jgi:hypothetical protein
MTDASQRFDVTHEFNHVLITSYGTFPGNVVSWIYESYNDYLVLLTAEHAGGATPGQSAQFAWPSNVPGRVPSRPASSIMRRVVVG